MTKVKKNISSFLILLSPIFHQYRSPIPGVTLGELLFLVVIVINLKHLKISKTFLKKMVPLFGFVVYCLLYPLVFSEFNIHFSYIALVTGIIRFLFYVVVTLLIVSLNVLNNNTFIVQYKYLGIIASSYLVLQFFVHLLLGSVLPWRLPFLSVYAEGYTQIDFISNFSIFYRPYSFFLEPGYYVQYMLPIFIFTVFNLKNKKNLFLSIFFTVCFFLSTSGQGIIICIIIWFIIIFRYLKNTIKQTSIKKIFIVSSFPFIGYTIFQIISSFEFINKSLNRLFIGDQASINSRLLSPIQLFKNLSFPQKFFGIGYNNIRNSLGEAAVSNSVMYILLVSGIIGAGFIFIYLVGLLSISIKNLETKILVMIFIILIFITGIFTSLNGAFYQMIILSMSKRNLTLLQKCRGKNEKYSNYFKL